MRNTKQVHSMHDSKEFAAKLLQCQNAQANTTTNVCRISKTACIVLLSIGLLSTVFNPFLETDLKNPVSVSAAQANMPQISSICMSGCTTAVITEDGDLYTWGSNASERGILGNGMTTDSGTPQKIMDRVSQVSIGAVTAAAVTDDHKLYTWGDYYLGNGSEQKSSLPVSIMGGIASTSIGRRHGAAITEDGELLTWGYNAQYQLGNGSTDTSYVPVKVMDHVASAALGPDITAVITDSGDLYTWGKGEDWMLGSGSSAVCKEPQCILSDVVKVEAGLWHMAAITRNGDLYTWGKNTNGQIGNGTTAIQKTPVKVLSNVKDVNAGASFTAALTKDNQLYTWGWASSGRLGNGTASGDVLKPACIMEHVAAIASGYDPSHFGVITQDGAFYTWGANNYQQLGDGTGTDRSSPTEINPNLSSAKKLYQLKSSEYGTVEFYLDETDFYQDSDEYHKSLGLLGIGLASAAYNDEEKEQAYYIRSAYRDDLNIPTEDYRLFSYQGAPENNVYQLEGMDDNDMAFSIAYKEFHETPVLFITLRGSGSFTSWVVQGNNGSISDWIYDISSQVSMPFYGGFAGAGFAAFADDVNRGLAAFMSDHPKVSEMAKNGRLKVFVCGHSLGAAGAGLVGCAINSSDSPLGYIDRQNLFVYTYAAPNNLFINQANAMPQNYYHHNIINIVNRDDLVPFVPLSYHSVTDHYLAAKAGQVLYFNSGDPPVRITVPRVGTDEDMIQIANGHRPDRYIEAVRDEYDDVVENAVDSAKESIVSVSGSGNVYIYKAGEIVGGVTDNQILDDTGIPIAVIDHSVSFYLPNDEDYEVRIVGTETGTFDFTAVTGSGDAIASRTCNQVSLTEGKEFSYSVSDGMNAAISPLLVLDSTGAPAMNVQPDGSEIPYIPDLHGDLNQDSQFTVADVILLQKWLLAEPGSCIANWESADFFEDGKLNVLDLCLMKRELLPKKILI